MQIDDLRCAGHEHDGRLALLPLAVVRRELVASSPSAKVEVRDDGIGVPLELLRDLDRVAGVPRDPDREVRAERERQRLECRLVVVDEQDPRPAPLHDRLTGMRPPTLGWPPNVALHLRTGEPDRGMRGRAPFVGRR